MSGFVPSKLKTISLLASSSVDCGINDSRVDAREGANGFLDHQTCSQFIAGNAEAALRSRVASVDTWLMGIHFSMRRGVMAVGTAAARSVVALGTSGACAVREIAIWFHCSDSGIGVYWISESSSLTCRVSLKLSGFSPWLCMSWFVRLSIKDAM